MPPSPGRRSFLSRVAGHLPAIDSTALLVALALIFATGAGGALFAASNRSPSPAPTGGPTTAAPHPTLAIGDGGAEVDPLHPPRVPGPDTPAATQQPEPTVTPEPAPTSDPPSLLTGYVWPIHSARISSKFGTRAGGWVVIDGKRVHDGLDLATWCGDKVRAAHAGTVLYAGRKFDPWVGYSGPLDNLYAHVTRMNLFPIVVVIDDGNGYRSIYVHLAVARVGAGDVVKAGQLIGLEGATGNATGCHLHYSLVRMDGAWQAVAPEHTDLYPPYLRERVDPLLVFPLRDPYAPQKFIEKYGTGGEPDLPFDPPAAGSDGE